MAHWLDLGQLSGLELTELYLERITRFGGILRSFITVVPEMARQQAADADRDRPPGQRNSNARRLFIELTRSASVLATSS